MNKDGVYVTSGSHRIRAAKVEVQLEHRSLEGRVEIVSPTLPGEDKWAEAFRFGVAYAIEKVGRARHGLIGEGIRVVPVGIEWMEVDTTSMQVVVATVFAVWDALKFVSPTPPRFEKGAFIIVE